MTTTESYAPSPTPWVRDQVSTIIETGDTASVSIQGMHVVLLTMVGAKSGLVRKVPLMRVEHDGIYAAVGSKGGAPADPVWVGNLRAHPRITLQDGTETHDVLAREIEGDERARWWARCVDAFPPYAEYATKTDRLIPVFLLEPLPTD